MNLFGWSKLSVSALGCTAIVGLAVSVSPQSMCVGDELSGASRAAKQPMQSLTRSSTLPPSIAAEARRRGVAISKVKRQGDYWVACDGEGAEASCLVLGKVQSSEPASSTNPLQLKGLTASTVLEVHRYGQAVQTFGLLSPNAFGRVTKSSEQGFCFELNAGVEARVNVQGRSDQVIDTLPRYRREGVNIVRTKDFQFVRDYIDARPGEPFTVIVTVPALCEPCRRLDQLLREKSVPHDSSRASNRSDSLLTKLFILEYFTFADAEREVLGSGAVFPTTLVYGVEAQPRRSISRLIGNLRGSSMDEITRPLAERFRRGSPHTMSRGVVAPELLFRPVTEQLTQR